MLEKANIPFELYTNIKPNPTIENVQTGVKAFKNSNADIIVAVGGGSSMDTAKAIAIIATNPEFADVRSLEGVAPTKINALRSSRYLLPQEPLQKLLSTTLSPTKKKS